MADTPQDHAEAARVRRRWLNLGEIVAILAVSISALTFWNSYSERTNAEAEKKAASVQSTRKATTLVLRGTPDKEGNVLTLASRDEEQAIQSQTITFPSALSLSAAETSGDARIEKKWFKDALVDARKTAGAADKTVGDARLPVLVVTRFIVDGDQHVDQAIYEIGYKTDHSFLGGTDVELRGLSRVGAVADEATGRKRIDATWASRLAAQKK